MRKVFWDNPYQTILTTSVAVVNGNEIMCNETIIFSFCGGQENLILFVSCKGKNKDL